MFTFHQNYYFAHSETVYVPVCHALFLSCVLCVCIEVEDVHGESGREGAGVHPHGRVAKVRPRLFGVTE